MNKRGIYDIEIDLDELLNTEDGLYNYYYAQELKQRRLFLQDDVDQWTVSPIVRHIHQYNIEDRDKPVEEREPIRIYIACRGGDVDPGFELVDAIRASKTPVYTINIGYAYSMGFLIMLAGHQRFSMPSSKFLLHDGQNLVWNSAGKVRDQLEFNKRLENKIKEYVIGRTTIPAEEYDAKFRMEWYMFADEAQEKGVIDKIIGVDVDLDAVI